MSRIGPFQMWLLRKGDNWAQCGGTSHIWNQSSRGWKSSYIGTPRGFLRSCKESTLAISMNPLVSWGLWDLCSQLSRGGILYPVSVSWNPSPACSEKSHFVTSISPLNTYFSTHPGCTQEATWGSICPWNTLTSPGSNPPLHAPLSYF